MGYGHVGDGNLHLNVSAKEYSEQVRGHSSRFHNSAGQHSAKMCCTAFLLGEKVLLWYCSVLAAAITHSM